MLRWPTLILIKLFKLIFMQKILIIYLMATIQNRRSLSFSYFRVLWNINFRLSRLHNLVLYIYFIYHFFSKISDKSSWKCIYDEYQIEARPVPVGEAYFLDDHEKVKNHWYEICIKFWLGWRIQKRNVCTYRQTLQPSYLW